MFFFLLYAGAGLYVVLIAAGVLHRGWMRGIDEYRRPLVRTALALFGFGIFGMGLYYVAIYYYEDQRRLERQEILERQRGDAQKSPAQNPAVDR